MHVRVFTLRFDPATERFDDSAVVGFLADKEVLAIRDHFFVRDGVPYLTLVARYRTGVVAAPAAGRPDANRDDPGNRNDDLGFRLASTDPVFPPDGRRSRTASPRVRFVQPRRARAGLDRTKSPSPPASGSASDGRRGYSLSRPVSARRSKKPPRGRRPMALALRLATDAVAPLQLAFVLFVVFGGRPVWRWARRARAPGTRARGRSA
jgi:hypothetical protein